MSEAPPTGGEERPTLVVVPMRPRHLPEVLAIEAQVYPRPWSERLFAEELERSHRVYLVARVGARVVGYAGLLVIADDGHVATIAVDPEWQGRGIARCLLRELVRAAMDLGIEQMTLEVRVSNLVAQHLYQSFGFVPGGARKAYYADNGEDALVMWAHGVATDAYAERLARIDAALAWEVAAPQRDDVPSAAAHPAARTAVEAS
ncbi:MAG: ribosomal protein S18-alanine N-acetyltransferase [Acidimicrobiales bacterium]